MANPSLASPALFKKENYLWVANQNHFVSKDHPAIHYQARFTACFHRVTVRILKVNFFVRLFLGGKSDDFVTQSFVFPNLFVVVPYCDKKLL